MQRWEHIPRIYLFAIGYIASYSQHFFGRGLVSKLTTRAEALIHEIETSAPDVLGLSNYCWNAELSRFAGQYAKKTRKGTIVVSGGPEFPTNDAEAADYLRYRDEIDLYVYNYEAEVTFLEILKRISSNESLDSIKSSPPPGVACLDISGRLVKSPPQND
jgi:hypothetical protein